MDGKAKITVQHSTAQHTWYISNNTYLYYKCNTPLLSQMQLKFHLKWIGSAMSLLQSLQTGWQKCQIPCDFIRVQAAFIFVLHNMLHNDKRSWCYTLHLCWLTLLPFPLTSGCQCWPKQILMHRRQHWDHSVLCPWSANIQENESSHYTWVCSCGYISTT